MSAPSISPPDAIVEPALSEQVPGDHPRSPSDTLPSLFSGPDIPQGLGHQR